MPTQSAGPNLGKSLAGDLKALESIRQLIKGSDEQFVGYRSSLYEALGEILTLTRTLVVEERLEAFVKEQGRQWGKVAAANPFQPVTAMAFNETRDASAASKYAKVLFYANEAKPADVPFGEWIEQQGGIEKVVSLVRDPARDPFERFEETKEDHHARALQVLQTRKLGQVKGKGAIGTGEGYQRALVRIVNGSLEVVDIVPASEDALKSDMFALVPAEPPRARRRLKDKSHYELFQACDIASRWFSRGEQASATKLVGLDGQDALGTHAPDAAALLERVKTSAAKRKREEKAQLAARYFSRSALRFTFTEKRWRVETTSTLPGVPVFTCSLTSALPELDPSLQYFLDARQVNRVAESFAETESWTLRVRNTGSKSYDASGSGEIVLDELKEDIAWRALVPPGQRGEGFKLTRDKLNAVEAWLQGLRHSGSGLRSSKMLSLMVDGEVMLAIPKVGRVLRGKDRTVDRVRLQQTGTFPFAAVRAISSLESGALTDRYLARSDLLTLQKIGAEYGVDFDCDFLTYNEGVAALSLRTEDWNLTIPLIVSLSGHRAEISKLLWHADQKA